MRGALFISMVPMAQSWIVPDGTIQSKYTTSALFSSNAKHDRAMIGRRTLLSSAASLVVLPQASQAVTRAVGSGEIACRENNNCLETGEFDGAVGWMWGGKDRCDPLDPLCGPDGKLRDAIVGKPVPSNSNEITHVVVMRVDVGREESGVLKLGLFGKEAPGSVDQLVSFLGDGFSTMKKDDNLIGALVVPVSLVRGGVVDSIVPGTVVDFGVPSQTNAYARSRGMSKASDFLPQPRPLSSLTAIDTVPRSHDAAGLVSLPIKGLGYGGTGFESDDEAYESGFLVTAEAVPSLDKSRRVVGQVLDNQSMAFLERLASLPTKRGIRGVIPGQTSGPPLLKTVVRDVAVDTVTQKT